MGCGAYVTNNGRHLRFYRELEISLKPQEIFCLLVFLLSLKEKKTCIFIQKWLDHLLLVT